MSDDIFDLEEARRKRQLCHKKDAAPKQRVYISGGKGTERIIDLLQNQIVAERKRQGKELYPCFNQKCPTATTQGTCSKKQSWDCLYQMVEPPPNPMDYEGEMPSHREALQILEEQGNIKGELTRIRAENMKYVESKAQGSEERYGTEIHGITMAQLEACVLTLFREAREDGNIFAGMGGGLSLEEEEIFAKNLLIEVEKAMGIYPNIRPLK